MHLWIAQRVTICHTHESLRLVLSQFARMRFSNKGMVSMNNWGNCNKLQLQKTHEIQSEILPRAGCYSNAKKLIRFSAIFNETLVLISLWKQIKTTYFETICSKLFDGSIVNETIAVAGWTMHFVWRLRIGWCQTGAVSLECDSNMIFDLCGIFDFVWDEGGGKSGEFEFRFWEVFVEIQVVIRKWTGLK